MYIYFHIRLVLQKELENTCVSCLYLDGFSEGRARPVARMPLSEPLGPREASFGPRREGKGYFKNNMVWGDLWEVYKLSENIKFALHI